MAAKNSSTEKVPRPKPAFGELVAIARRKITISWYISAIIIISIVVIGGLTGRYAIVAMNESKLKDTWAILFLEMEKITDSLGANLSSESFAKNLTNAGKRNPDLAFLFDGKADSALSPVGSGKRKDDPGERLTADSLGYDIRSGDLAQFATIQGKSYLVRRRYDQGGSSSPADAGKIHLDLYQTNLSRYFEKIVSARQADTFIINRGGKLFFTSNPELKQEQINKLPVVAYFVRNSMAAGQTEIEDRNGDIAYAFFKEIPGTNLILFSSVKRAVALAPVRQAETSSWWALMGAVFAAGILVQIPLAYIRSPLSRLITQTRRLGTGDFSLRTLSSGFGEIRILSESFSTMATSLADRDRRIQALLIESRQKARLEKEMLIAKGIQENLLPERGLSADANVEVYTSYKPAEEVAGDWYSYCYNDSTGETLIVISDVSGHGAGSSMFTGIIAEIFEDMVEQNQTRSFPMADFASVINRRILKFGRGAWHSTLAVVKIGKGNDYLEYLNAGHTPLIVKTDTETSVIRLPSNPLGIEADVATEVRRIPFAEGASAILFTDGLIEAKSTKNRPYGLKRLYKIVASHNQGPCKRIVDALIKDWRTHTDQGSAGDDVCLIGFRKVG